MRRTVFSIVLFLALGPAALAHAQRLPGEPGAQKGTVPADNPLPNVPDNALHEVDERDRANSLAEQPMKQLTEALDKLSEGDLEAAAENIAKAAERTRAAAGRSNSGEIRDALLVAADTLASLSKKVEAGAITADELAPGFARDLQVMSRYHADRARMNWEEYEDTDAGFNLRTAAGSLRQAFTWAQLEKDLGIPEVVAEADYAANLIISEQGVDRRDVDRIIDKLDQASRLLGEQLRNGSS